MKYQNVECESVRFDDELQMTIITATRRQIKEARERFGFERFYRGGFFGMKFITHEVFTAQRFTGCNMTRAYDNGQSWYARIG